MNTFLNIFAILAEAGPPPFNLGVAGSIFSLIGITAIYFGIGSGKESKRDISMLIFGLAFLIFGMIYIFSALIHDAKNEILYEIRKTQTPAERPITPKQS